MLKLCVAFLLATTAVLSQPLPPAPIQTVWEGMYAPPYLQSPQMVIALDCVSENNCYLAGGSNGVGFGVYQYNGKQDGQVTGPMTEPNMSMMVMDIATGGTEANPTGAFSSVVDFTIGAGLQYLANKGTEWLPSSMPTEIVWASQSIAGSNDGQTYVAVGNGFTNDLMISTNGGLNFYNQNFNYKASDNCSYPAYIATPNNKAWFLTFGAEPAQHHKHGGGGSGSSSSTSGSGSSSSFGGADGEVNVNAKYYNTKTEKIVGTKANGRVLIIKNIVTGKNRVVTKTGFEHRDDQLRAAASDNTCNYYYGAILKSTDQGKTWVKVYENKNAMVSFIQCFDEESCAATAFNAAESYTITTTDGGNFKVTYTTPPSSSTMALSLSAIGYASKTEVWAAGSQETQSSGAGMFWSSKDGGNTWTQYPHYIPDVMVIMGVDFTPSGVGFAVGMTMFKTTQIMRYKKQADYGNFIQAHCPVAGCAFLCQNITFPLGFCLSTNGGSAKAFCQNGELLQYTYTTTSCVGSYTKNAQPINKCLNGTNTFFENYCPGGAGFSAAGSRKATDKDRFLF